MLRGTTSCHSERDEVTDASSLRTCFLGQFSAAADVDYDGANDANDANGENGENDENDAKVLVMEAL